MDSYSINIDIPIDDTLELVRFGKSWKDNSKYVMILYNNETKRYSYKHFNIEIKYT